MWQQLQHLDEASTRHHCESHLLVFPAGYLKKRHGNQINTLCIVLLGNIHIVIFYPFCDSECSFFFFYSYSDHQSAISTQSSNIHPHLFTWTVDKLWETRLSVIDSINASHYHFIFAKLSPPAEQPLAPRPTLSAGLCNGRCSQWLQCLES